MISAAAAFPGKDHCCKLRDSPCAVCTGVRQLLDQKSALGNRTADLYPPYLPKPPLSCVRFLVCSFQRQLGLALKHTEPWTRTWIFSDRSLSRSLMCLSQQLIVPAVLTAWHVLSGLLSWPAWCCTTSLIHRGTYQALPQLLMQTWCLWNPNKLPSN